MNYLIEELHDYKCFILYLRRNLNTIEGKSIIINISSNKFNSTLGKFCIELYGYLYDCELYVY